MNYGLQEARHDLWASRLLAAELRRRDHYRPPSPLVFSYRPYDATRSSPAMVLAMQAGQHARASAMQIGQFIIALTHETRELLRRGLPYLLGGLAVGTVLVGIGFGVYWLAQHIFAVAPIGALGVVPPPAPALPEVVRVADMDGAVEHTLSLMMKFFPFFLLMPALFWLFKKD